MDEKKYQEYKDKFEGKNNRSLLTNYLFGHLESEELYAIEDTFKARGIEDIGAFYDEIVDIALKLYDERFELEK